MRRFLSHCNYILLHKAAHLLGSHFDSPLGELVSGLSARCLEVASTATGSVYIKKWETIRRRANARMQM